MKKRAPITLLLSLLMLISLAMPAQAAAPVKLWVDGNYVKSDVEPFIKNNRTLVPLRVISENLGIDVEWNNEARQVYLLKEDIVIAFEIGKAEYGYGDISKPLDVAPNIYNNRTFLPLRAIAEIFDKNVDWDNTNRTAIVGDGYTAPADPLSGNRIISVDGGDLSGYRESNVKVDIGFGNREYWAYTNEYGQLVKVTADRIILQDDINEPVNSRGRYYNDEAKVPGTESPNLDEGHVIADSLGGVSNAYNITPQNATLNRHGDQAYMEKSIRDAILNGGSCTNFVATITYPNTQTQIPSHYEYKYVLNGNQVVDSFDNVNPDVVNKPQDTANPKPQTSEKVVVNPSRDQEFTADTTQGIIKGNKKSKIYHVPGGASYNRISVKNVVFFNSEADAQAAGYRRAKR